MSLLGHVIGGGAYFSGAAMLAAGPVLFALTSGLWAKRLAVVAVCVGVVMVIASAVAQPGWVYGVWIAALIGWASAERWGQETLRWPKPVARGAAVLACVGAMGMEWGYTRIPMVGIGADTTVFVIGDSLTAGMGAPGEMTWPRVLGGRGYRVRDLSRAGVGVAGAQSQAAQVDGSDGVVVLLIGGNDILDGMPVAEFENGLESLVVMAGGEKRRVMMFELPLLPFGNGYGRAQRRVAARHGVVLAPRWMLARVLTDPGATTDGLHLSAAGHVALADAVCRVAPSAPRAR
jgi:acyl-CoA thioesterase-1